MPEIILRDLYYNIALNIPESFNPQGTIVRQRERERKHTKPNQPYLYVTDVLYLDILEADYVLNKNQH
jgi:hypothetical protein